MIIQSSTHKVGNTIIYNEGQFLGDNGLIFLEEVQPHVLPDGKKKRKAKFLCTCGEVFESIIANVKRGNTESCGCVQKQMMSETKSGSNNHHWRGGIKSHYLYPTWESMMQRCYNENCKGYKSYGARGIKVFEPWHDSKVFLEFCDTVLGERPEGYSLDRIDNDKGYHPDNVRWADAKTQANNRRSK